MEVSFLVCMLKLSQYYIILFVTEVAYNCHLYVLFIMLKGTERIEGVVYE
jgi:hypothetical protein